MANPDSPTIPTRLDDPPKFMWWDFDVAMLFMSFFVFGLITGWLVSFTVFGLVMVAPKPPLELPPTCSMALGAVPMPTREVNVA